MPTLTSLLELNLDHTHISDVPAELGCLRSLEGLQMEGCPLASPLDKLYAHSPLLLVQVRLGEHLHSGESKLRALHSGISIAGLRMHGRLCSILHCAWYDD